MPESPLTTLDAILKERYPEWTLPEALERIRELAAEVAHWKRLADSRLRLAQRRAQKSKR